MGRFDLLDRSKDEVLLAGRVLLMILFVVFGWQKLTGFDGTVAYMASEGTPVPQLSAAIAVLMEVPVAIAIALGFWTRPLALLMALYTLGTALIGHRYWTMQDPSAHFANEINFYKNLSIMGGLLTLCVSGPGKYSLDRK
jgi:putative oxidoreductase